MSDFKSIWIPDLANMDKTCPAADLGVGDSADRANTRHDHPKNKGTEKQPDDCPCESRRKLDEFRVLFAGPFEPHHSDAGHERIDNKRKDCAA